MTNFEIFLILIIFLVCELFIIITGSILNYFIRGVLISLMNFVDGNLIWFNSYLILFVIIIILIRIIVPNTKELLKIIMSILAFFAILFYLYIRFIVKKLPQNLPSKEYPELSILLYSGLTLLYIFFLIILPIYQILKGPQTEQSEIVKFIKNLINIIGLPFIWLYEYISCNLFLKTDAFILNIGENLFKLRKKSRQIIYIIYILPRLLAGLTLIVEILYVNKIYYFYYVLWLLFIQTCFHLYLLMLQKEKNELQILYQGTQIGYLINIEQREIEDLMNIPVELIIIRTTRFINPECTEEEVKEIEDTIKSVNKTLTKMGKAHILTIIYAKILRESLLKKYLYLNLFLFLIGWSLALTICILNYPI